MAGRAVIRAAETESELAKEPDSEDASTSKPPRRPITIDLAAEEIGRKGASAEATAASAASAQTAGPAAADPAGGPDKPKAEQASAMPDNAAGARTNDKAGATGQEIPPAFATRKTGTSSPPRWRPIDDPPQRRPFAPFLIAAFAGAAIAAIAVVALVFTGYLSPKSDDGLAAEIEALKGEVASLKQATPDEGLTSLQQQVAALEQKIGEAAAPSPSGPTEAQLKEVQDRITALEQADGGEDSTADLETQLIKLTEDVAALKNATPADAASLESALAPVREQLDQLSTRIDQLSARVDAAPAEDRVAAIEAKLDETSQRIDLAAALAPAVIADALDAAVDAGRPFPGELGALKNLGMGGDAVDQLAADAEAGVATLAELRSGFEAAIGATDLTPTAPATTGTIDRLWQSAQGLVDVRPAHPTEGTDPGAIVARVRGALDAGDLKRALDEWNSLPYAIRTPMADWARQAEARIKADDLVAAVRSAALSRLGAGQ